MVSLPEMGASNHWIKSSVKPSTALLAFVVEAGKVISICGPDVDVFRVVVGRSPWVYGYRIPSADFTTEARRKLETDRNVYMNVT